MRSFALPPDCHHLVIRPWHDAVVDGVGHDLRSRYVERFWMSLLGPTSTCFLRYLADHFETTTDEFELDLVSCAAAIGLGRGIGRSSAMSKTIGRCCSFRVARMVNRRTLEVRQRLAPLSGRQVRQLPQPLRDEHARWLHDHTDPAVHAALLRQARRMALSILGAGENAEYAEQQLQRWRFPSSIAQAAASWANDNWTGKPVVAPL